MVTTAPNSARAATAVLRAGDQERTVPLTGSSLGFFEPIRTRHLSITFDRTGLVDDERSVGVAELRLTGLDDLRYQVDDDTPTGSICGLGPPVVVDGRTFETRVIGTAGQLRSGAPMELRSCDGPLMMAAGQHRVDVLATGQFAPVSVFLASAQAPSQAPLGTRDTEVVSWGREQRKIRVGSGQASVLRVAENLNDGWKATLAGEPLERTSVDGWQQGYVVPAGEGGTVVLTFTPDRSFRVALLVGAAAALFLLLGAVVSLVFDRRQRRETRAISPAEDPAPARRFPSRRRRRVTRVLVLLIAGLLGGVGVAVGALMAMFARTERLLPTVAGGLVAVAGLVGAVAALTDQGIPWLADLLAAIAVGVLVCLTFLSPTDDGDLRG